MSTLAESIRAAGRFRDTQSLAFNGSNQWLQTSASPTFAGDTAGAVACWVRVNSLLSANSFKTIWAYTLAANDSSAKRLTLWHQYLTSVIPVSAQNRNLIDVYDSGTAQCREYVDLDISTGWYHFVLMGDGSNHYLSINGVAQTLIRWNGRTPSSDGRWFGHMPASPLLFSTMHNTSGVRQYYSDQTVGEAQVFSRLLTSEEITRLYNNGKPGNSLRAVPLEDHRAIWRFGDLGDDTSKVYDRLGNSANDLVLNGSPSYTTTVP